jgi:methionine biosynthesis protein MetW
MDINSPTHNDNRNYDYSSAPEEFRTEYNLILDFVESGSSVIDLGCGNGSLLSLLQKNRACTGTGIELSASGVAACLTKGLNVIQGRIDEPLQFADKAFDYAICNVTIQMVNYPEILLSEMKRVAKKLIISFPNFGFYKNRIDFCVHGRMPRPMLFGYSWYATGHIHQLSIKDFYELIAAVGGLRVLHAACADQTSGLKRELQIRFPNLFQLLPVFLLSSDN